MPLIESCLLNYVRIKTPIILDCGCNSHGTNTENGTAICDSSFGNCSCTTGYSGQKCDHCVNDYFITNPGGSNSTCNGCFLPFVMCYTATTNNFLIILVFRMSVS